MIETLERTNSKLTHEVEAVGTSQRAQELQTIVDKHGSIDRAAAKERIPRNLFRRECQALGVQARRRSELLPRVSELDREARKQRDELCRQTDEVIDAEIDAFFAPAREAFGEVFYRIFVLNNDLQAAAKFLFAYDKMSWWQRDLLVLSQAVILEGANFNRRGSEAMLEAYLSGMRKAVLSAAAADPEAESNSSGIAAEGAPSPGPLADLSPSDREPRREGR
jgi:hypothetical protein